MESPWKKSRSDSCNPPVPSNGTGFQRSPVSFPVSASPACASLRSSRSYSLSAGCHREPRGQHVFCGIDVPVMEGLALWTPPEPFIQRKGCKHMPTVGTPLGRWVPLVNPDEGPPLPLYLLFQLTD